jgi:two-component system chemotaxis sensor kinase CheA
MAANPLPEHLLASYREEAAERIAELEAALLDLDSRPEDEDLVARAFRALHTIKGSGAMFGLDVLAGFTHEVEAVFDAVRAGRVPVTRTLVSLALAAKDHIRDLLAGGGNEGERARLVTKLRQLLPAAAPAAGAGAGAGAAPAAPQAPAQQTFRIRFKPQPQLFQDGTNVLGLLAELRSLGPCEIVARTDGLPPLEGLSPETCYLGWDLILTTDRGPDAIRDVFMFVEDRSELNVQLVDAGEGPPPEGDTRIGHLLVDRGDLDPAALDRALSERKRIGEELEQRGLVTPDAVQAAVVEQKVVREQQRKREGAAIAESTSSIRVAASKLDTLVDLVGELVIAQARLSRIAAGSASPELLSVAEDIDRLTTELRDSTLDVRMVPIGTTFGRFKRLVHDLADSLGKQIELCTEGAETELDKTVIERLADPLVHLIRNSCDHGVEAPDARAAAGKPARGTVRLAAFHSGSMVVIEIQDDGAGLDAEAIEAKARERGLIPPGAKLSEKELFSLIFLPGFSTARQVSSVSGRGVGMDVVKKAVEALRGSVAVDSVRGRGTTFRIQLPLTLAIIEGLLVAVGESQFVLPLAAVEECVQLTREDVERGHGSRVASVRGELVPYLRLREIFGVCGDRPDLEQIAIVRHEESRCGFVVDAVVGQHQTVIKSLGKMLRTVKGLSGATILGDGTVALIVDLPALIPAAGATA